ncbi:hypothetical protein [Streptomyces gilvosporeus]|uniref:Uncharacterized protein n=1 Tax=Streptomyces gilvosporeus TaxID=553510 RepID=A0A1V0TQ84_9ACTN|nr:hypothetical protein [Streptomyces gilvosporeus]ARF55095.1 hypothetical protein B1H19_13570 [Streptomyces gilvosporeus]
MSTVTERQAQDSLELIDVELIGDSTDCVLRMHLGASKRNDIDAKTLITISHLEMLLAEDLGADDDDAVRGMYRQAYRLLELANRPTSESTTFAAFFYLRDVANLTRRLLWIYAGKAGTDVR